MMSLKPVSILALGLSLFASHAAMAGETFPVRLSRPDFNPRSVNDGDPDLLAMASQDWRNDYRVCSFGAQHALQMYTNKLSEFMNTSNSISFAELAEEDSIQSLFSFTQDIARYPHLYDVRSLAQDLASRLEARTQIALDNQSKIAQAIDQIQFLRQTMEGRDEHRLSRYGRDRGNRSACMNDEFAAVDLIIGTAIAMQSHFQHVLDATAKSIRSADQGLFGLQLYLNQGSAPDAATPAPAAETSPVEASEVSSAAEE